jgi:5'-nucleotidase
MASKEFMTKGCKSKLLATLIVFFALAFALPVLHLQAQPTRPDLTLTILHTNDIHAHDEAFTDHGKEVGGLARIGYLIHSIKRKTPNVVAIDAGDIFQGTYMFRLYKGATEVSLLNQAGYDIYTIGNHEFDEGPENLAKQLSAAHFSVISANVDARKLPALAHIVNPYVVKNIDGKRVAFVGAVTPELESTSLGTGDVHIAKCAEAAGDWVCPIRTQVDKLKSQGISHIILVTHCGVEMDKELAAAIPDVDAIVGGHSHTRLEKPIIVNRGDGSSCMIVQAGCYGRALGKMVLAFDKSGKLMFPQSSDYLISINDKIPSDPEMLAYIKEKAKPVEKLRAQVLGVALRDFNNNFRGNYKDSTIGDLITDALADAGTTYGASISFQNRGGIRSRLEHGVITMDKIEEILPFDNKLVFATVPGSTIKSVLERSVSGGAKFMDVHGLRVTYDASAERGNRIRSIETLTPTGKYIKLKPEGKYKIAVNDYNFSGGEGYEFAGATDLVRTDKRLATILAEYLLKQKKVTPCPPDRMIPINIPVKLKKH